MLKQAVWKIKGMQRDLAESTFNSQYSYENMNMRLVSLDSNTTLALVNEKGTQNIEISGIGYDFIGVPIGTAVINNQCILFTTSETDVNKDRIYKITYNDELNGKLIFEGNLNFNAKYPLETLCVYENEDVQKVYWTDNLNQPRVINVSDTSILKNTWNNNSFDFVKSLNLKENVYIMKNTNSNGEFASGTIQYCFSYFNKYGQESNIFYTSPLYYCSLYDRGVAADDKVGNSFKILISNLDTSFDYLRIYSIHRSSENGTPLCKKVVDLQINKNTQLSYTDNNLNGEIIDPTELLYIGGEEIIAKTLTQKDGTLFLGNIKLKQNKIDSDIKNQFKENVEIHEENSKYIFDNSDGYYGYKNQLDTNSRIKSFKYLETYRLGIQLQFKSGKWSDPIFIKDHTVQNKPKFKLYKQTINKYNKLNNYALINIYGKLDSEFLKEIHNNLDFVKIRPVIVFPKINERTCICQGIVCPTVFNVYDRMNNSPYVYASWYPRPDSPLCINDSNENNKSTINTDYGSNPVSSKYNSPHSIISNFSEDVDLSQIGKWSEFRHYKNLPYCDEYNAEIQCNYLNDKITDCNKNGISSDAYVSKYKDLFFVDKSIVTFHSPDIEFNNEVKNLNIENLKFRIIGKVNFTANISDVDITTATKSLSGLSKTIGLNKYKIGVDNFSFHGWKSGMGMPYWIDHMYKAINKTDDPKLAYYQQSFVIYPWHRNKSLINQDTEGENGIIYAEPKRKVISNLKVSAFNTYCDNIWEPENGISNVSIFNSDEISLIKIKSNNDSNFKEFNYYGNVDKVVNNTNSYPIIVSGQYPVIGPSLNEINDTIGVTPFGAFKNFWRPLSNKLDLHNITMLSSSIKAYDPVRIKYKSSPHAIFAFNYTNGTDKKQIILPTSKQCLNNSDLTIENQNNKLYSTFWDDSFKIKQDVIDIEKSPYGYLWLGELYNPNVDIKTRFGGQTEEAFSNNDWLPAGEPVDYDRIINQNEEICWSEGDTYFQRYDHLKTQPFNKDDQQSLIEIVSFMCETRINLDGRYDKNRGLSNNLNISSNNFNLLNPAYNQINNFFIYHNLNSELYYPDKFINTVTWTKSKNNSELVDTWCNVTMANTLNLEGNKGQINALRKYNDQLLAFQDKSISQILYNENVQISTVSGVPIEIANSGKVQGCRTLTNQIGCSNKHSICETPNSLYFIDSNSKNLYAYNGQFNNLSLQKGFISYFNNRVNFKEWNPEEFNNFKLQYDNNTQDVYMINKNDCLSYNENLGEFSSFYNYESVPYIINLQNLSIALKDNRFWNMYSSYNNRFFEKYKPYYVTIIANTNPLSDKIFNQVEFRSDTWIENTLTNETFDTLSVWNEYQKSTSRLNFQQDAVTNLKKKFRIWRANIPRNINTNGDLHLSVDSNNISKDRKYILGDAQKPNDIKINYTRDRIRNPWTYIQLSKETNLINKKTILHDMTINYFE